MAPRTDIRLVVLSDDFGMCEAVNEGIAQAFTRGLLTDANLMAPCPAFPQAAKIAKDLRIPVGMHATYTAEWDTLRWGPLTELKSMVQPDGTFHTTVADAWKQADDKETEAEFEAQWWRITQAGLKVTHICEHMGAERQLAALFGKKCREKKVPYRNFSLNGDQLGIPRYRYDSVFASSGQSTDLSVTKSKLKQWLHSIGPGYHLWATHCAIDDPSLDKLCSPAHVGFHWARTYRAIDQSLVLDPEVRGWIEARGIERISIAQCPVVGL
jgi:predicted glycoside hydrolase/deacetylase ChbG (UPF0249 family)